MDLLLREPSYFKTAKIDMMVGTEVVNVNWPAKSFTYRTLGSQLKSLQYDYLVLAMGLRPRKLANSLPGSQLRNIFYVRSLEDASRLVSKNETTTMRMLQTTVSLRRSSQCSRNEKYRRHRRFVHSLGVLWLAHDGSTHEEECFSGDESQNTDVSSVSCEHEPNKRIFSLLC